MNIVAGHVVLNFEGLFATTPTPLMVLDRQLCFIAANDRYLGMLGRSWSDIVGRYVFDAFPESRERRAAIEDAFNSALDGAETRLEKILFAIQQPNGSWRDFHWTAHQQPVRAADGSIIGVMQHTVDVSAEVAAERMRDAISQEYDHRVRNILTKVSAIARRTAHHSTQNAGAMQQFLADFDPRIASMARAHQMLVHGGWERLGIAELVESELQPYAPDESFQIVIDGPNVSLSSRVAQALGMALHELATNAVKYGALSRPDGRLSVCWTIDDAAGLALQWTETGLTGLTEPTRTGFGSTIIDRILPAETNGSVVRRFDDGGMVCTIAVPSPSDSEPARS